MSNVLSILGIVLAAVIAFVLVRAAMLPSEFRVSRSIAINASREKVFALIDHMHAFNQWNPFAKMDPSTQTAYRGPDSGPGSAFDWEGTGKAGKGSLEITHAEPPSSVTMKLDIYKPMEGHNRVVFALQPSADATSLSWTMTGPYPFSRRIFGAIFNMDKMIGGMFDSGLADLKRLAESPDAK